MKKAYKTEVLLTAAQQQKANQTIGVCRYVYNLYLETAQNHYKETKKAFVWLRLFKMVEQCAYETKRLMD